MTSLTLITSKGPTSKFHHTRDEGLKSRILGSHKYSVRSRWILGGSLSWGQKCDSSRWPGGRTLNLLPVGCPPGNDPVTPGPLEA